MQGRHSNSAIETSRGIFIDPLNPHAGEIDLADIIHALSMICRFSGHTSRFYSVLEHSLYVYELVDEWTASGPATYASYADLRAALMHDASEAYLNDLVSPLKHSDDFAVYRDAEKRMQAVIASVFDCTMPEPQIVKRADLILLWCEAAVLLPSRGTRWNAYEREGRKIIESNSEVCGWIRDGRYQDGHITTQLAFLQAAESVGIPAPAGIQMVARLP